MRLWRQGAQREANVSAGWERQADTLQGGGHAARQSLLNNRLAAWDATEFGADQARVGR